MNRLNLKWRVAAAVIAVGTPSSIVWAMSDYAYPAAVEYQIGQLRGREVFRRRCK